jgi:DNA modification methylase
MSNLNFHDAYPISLQEIKAKLAKRKRRNKTNYEQLELISNDNQRVKKITNEFGEDIVRVDGDIPINLPVSQGERFLFISYDQSVLTHGLHKYPAKFFPELPRWLIQRYSQEHDLILDPFSGSGTTNLEALLCRRHSVGIDIDPFSRFIAKVKTKPLNESELKFTQSQLVEGLVNYQASDVKEKEIPSFPYRDTWFKKEIILELSYIKKIISSLDTSEDIKSFYLVCLSSIIREVSNADNNCTRTVIRKKFNKPIYPADALKKFAERILIEIPKMIQLSQIYPSDIQTMFPDNMDAKNLNFADNYFDLAITSPPYVNAVDYPRTHQLEIYWLGFFENSLTPLKKKQVGTESVSSRFYKYLHRIDVEEADQKITAIFEKDPRRAYIAYQYLADMRKNLEEVYKVLKVGKYYIIVVGNNTIRGTTFENWKYIMSLAEQVGFTVEIFFASEIIKHFIKVPRDERINTDWIVVLKK